MDGVAVPRRTSYGGAFGLSMTVALGWYVVVASAVFVGWSGVPVPAAPEEDCWAVFSCLHPAEEAAVVLVLVAGPVLAGAVVVATVVAALLARHVRSPLVTGTVSALCGAVGVVAVFAVGNGGP